MKKNEWKKYFPDQLNWKNGWALMHTFDTQNILSRKFLATDVSVERLFTGASHPFLILFHNVSSYWKRFIDFLCAIISQRHLNIQSAPDLCKCALPCQGWWQSCPCTPQHISATPAPPTVAYLRSPLREPEACCCAANTVVPGALTAPPFLHLTHMSRQGNHCKQDYNFIINGAIRSLTTLVLGLKKYFKTPCVDMHIIKLNWQPNFFIEVWIKQWVSFV